MPLELFVERDFLTDTFTLRIGGIERFRAVIEFYEEAELLARRCLKRSFSHPFRGSPAIKDVIEAIGVPHTEIDLILANGASVDFDYHLQPGDHISVYPMFESLDIGPVTRLRPQPLRDPKFICDVHLGRLARRLRLLGFDVAYRNDADDPEIVEVALAEKRIILTCDRGILKLKRVTHGYFVRSREVNEQVVEVMLRLDLATNIAPFTRCTQCNGLIRSADKDTVQEDVPPVARQQYDKFFRCEACGKVYWEGSHFERLQVFVRKVTATVRQKTE